jgi:hypothetical protein
MRKVAGSAAEQQPLAALESFDIEAERVHGETLLDKRPALIDVCHSEQVGAGRHRLPG